jgi:TolB-like protein
MARRGYRFIAPVMVPGVSSNVDLPSKAEPDQRARKAIALRRLVASLLAGLFGGALLLAIVLTFNIAGAREWLRARTSPIHSIAVLPLENLSRDPEQEYFADGMTDELITNLARLGILRVVSRTSVMRYKKVSDKPLAQIGRELNVDAVVEGTVERVGTRVRIRVQLIHADTDRHLWAQSYDRELRDTLLLQSQAAGDIVREIQSSLTTPQQQRLAAARPVNPEAYEAYLRGLYFCNKRSAENFTRAIAYFQQAVAIDPSYAAPYSGLSDAFFGQTFTGTPAAKVRERATLAAMKSIELDSSLPEAHTSMALIHELYDWDWAAAEKEYLRAIELNPNFARGHQEYANFLSEQGRFNQSFAEAQRAQELDPLSPFIRTTYCLDFYFARRYTQAAQKCREALDIDPDFYHAHDNLRGIYAAMQQPDQAFQEYLKTAALSGRSPAQLAELRKSFQSEGLQGIWHTQLRWSQNPDSDAYNVASRYALLGQTDQAFAWLQKAYDQRSTHMEDLKQESDFDSIRSDPRFSDLLHRLNLQ